MRDYTKIEAWKLADDLTVVIYQRTQFFPREELCQSLDALELGRGSAGRAHRPGAPRRSGPLRPTLWHGGL